MQVWQATNTQTREVIMGNEDYILDLDQRLWRNKQPVSITRDHIAKTTPWYIHFVKECTSLTYYPTNKTITLRTKMVGEQLSAL